MEKNLWIVELLTERKRKFFALYIIVILDEF